MADLGPVSGDPKMSLLGSCDIAKKDLEVLAWLECQREKERERRRARETGRGMSEGERWAYRRTERYREIQMDGEEDSLYFPSVPCLWSAGGRIPTDMVVTEHHPHRDTTLYGRPPA